MEAIMNKKILWLFIVVIMFFNCLGLFATVESRLFKAALDNNFDTMEPLLRRVSANVKTRPCIMLQNQLIEILSIAIQSFMSCLTMEHLSMQ